MSLTFTPGQPCGGGSHWHVTANLDGETFDIPVVYGENAQPMTVEEKQEYIQLSLKYLMSTSAADGNNMESVRGKLRQHTVGRLP